MPQVAVHGYPNLPFQSRSTVRHAHQTRVLPAQEVRQHGDADARRRRCRLDCQVVTAQDHRSGAAGLQFDVVETFQNEDGSRVASRWRVSGRNNGMFGLPPDQREVSFTGTAVWQIREDGKLLHNWVERASWEAYQALAAST